MSLYGFLFRWAILAVPAHAGLQALGAPYWTGYVSSIVTGLIVLWWALT